MIHGRDLSIAIRVAATAGPRLAKLKNATDNVEAVFVKDLVSLMRKSAGRSPQAHAGSEIYRDMLDQALADSIAKTGTFGFSKSLYQQFSKEVVSAEFTRIKREAMEAAIDIQR